VIISTTINTMITATDADTITSIQRFGLNQILIGLLFVINSFIIHYFFENGKVVGDVNAMIGAALLGYPIVWTAIKDLRKGRLSTNELVALAVLASFASGEYQESGSGSLLHVAGRNHRNTHGGRGSGVH
jgi:cation transport ATPase